MFTRQHRLTLLKDGRIIHGKCYWAAIGRRELTGDEHEKRCYYPFPKDTPEFDFSNIGYETKSKSFRYAIQIVSKSVIHLYLIEPYHYMKHHFCLTYDECKRLIHEIKANLERLKQFQDAAVGKCASCGHPIYADKNRYQMDSGEMIHETCMERFIRSEASAKVRFPAKLICREDVFGHTLIFGESFGPSLFSDSD